MYMGCKHCEHWKLVTKKNTFEPVYGECTADFSLLGYPQLPDGIMVEDDEWRFFTGPDFYCCHYLKAST